MPDPLLDRVIRVLRETQALPGAQRLDEATSLLDSGLALDSIALLDFVLALEREFDCELDDADLTRERLATLGSAAELIRARLAAPDTAR